MHSPATFKGTVALLLSALLATGCHTPPAAPPSDPVPLSWVLNAVKDELAEFMTSASTIPTQGGACFKAKGSPIRLLPTAAKVTLKVVDARQAGPSASVGLPVGVIEATVSGSSSTSEKHTQTLLVPLTVVSSKEQPITAPKPGSYPIASTLKSFRDELLKVDRDRTPCLKYNDKTPLKLSIDFEVLRTSEAGIKLKLLGFELGQKASRSSATTQTLEIDLALVDAFDGPGVLSKPVDR